MNITLIFNKIKQFLAANTWEARINFLWVSGFIAIVVWLFPLLLTIFRGAGKDPIELCVLWAISSEKNGIIKLQKHDQNLVEISLAFGIWTFIFICFYIYLIKNCREWMASSFINKPLRPIFSTIAFGVCTLLSLVPSAFKNHTIETYGVAFIVLFWGFCLQMFLQPKTDFGLFTCISSSLLTIFTGLVQCQPKNFGDLISFGGFFIILGFYYYYCRVTYAPLSDEVHFRLLGAEINYFSFKLRPLGNNERDETIKRSLTPNELYHVQYIKKNREGSQICNLIPSCSIDSDIRNFLLENNPNENQYLNQYYVIEPIIDHPRSTTHRTRMERMRKFEEERDQHTRLRSPLQRSVSEVGTSRFTIRRFQGRTQATEASIELV